MRDESSDFLSFEEEYELVNRFDEAMDSGATQFFDVHEFIALIDFYIDHDVEERVLQALTLANKIYPNSLEIKYKWAEYYHYIGENDKALEIIQYFENVDSSNPELYYLKGEVLYESGNLNAAVESFDKAISIEPVENIELLHRISTFFLESEEINLALKYLLISYRKERNNLAVLFDLGYCFERLNELEKSVRYYNEYLDINPFSASAWYNLGIVHTKLGEFDKAIECYDFCIAIDPAYSSAYHNKGNTLATLERYDEAAKVFEELSKIDSEDSKVFSLLAECYEKTENYEKALDAYNKAITLNPDFAEGYYGIGVVLAGKKKYDLSLNFIRRALTLNPEEYDFWLGLGRVYFELNDIENSIKAYQEATTLNPELPDAYLSLAEVLLYEERFNEVHKLVEGIGNRFDTNISMKIINAAALYLSHRSKEALDILKDVKKMDPSSINDFINLVEPGNDSEFIDRINEL
ncbi:tetratricopeptide repeat protein [Tenuifilum thalassicum]|uniref:Tetratricopeptide repeat protein n=1 Tax=Tenuifilum thalassicum TaxID=2590900 RepID=A0A7D3XKV6_9BACT|nr:tetratricopeptide repeat protein [Tenuifilum thalassicum]QKG79855.1 tetratricopeptide repeat protein [Tenuifilum thalassicum]